MRFSVIIPAYNEARYLPRLLESIRVAAERFGSDQIEVIVADNLSTDSTADIIGSMNCRTVTVKKRRIAAARNGGAKTAIGEVFCFIDADSALHPDTFYKIDNAMRDQKRIAGATGVFLERRSIGLLATYLCMMPALLVTGMDTGVVFCRREDFEAVGGYNEELYFAEDVAFLLALKRRGWTKRQRLIRLSGVRALGCTRKFDERGDWHYFTMIPKYILLMASRGMSTFFKQENIPSLTDYWYRPGR
jgi:glycosyltransferase involved in cell wall biosynthesis